MAIINVNDAYILNETGAQVDKTTGIPFKNESLTEAEAAQARANIRAGGSNPNLLDNWYFVGGGSQLGDGVFPINQRGQTVYTSDGPGIDRWKQFAATVTLASDGVTVTPSAYSNNFLQLMNPAKWNALVGETVTLSIEVLAVTGTITVAGYNTGIGTITSPGIAAFTFTMPSGIADRNKFFGLARQSGSSIKFGRWKLEKGTVSTLLNDPPPDFGEELRKCQRYLWVEVFNTNAIIANGASVSASDVMLLLPTPASMRAVPPTVTFTVTPAFIGSGSLIAATYAGAGIYDNNVNLYFTGSVTAFSNYSLLATSQTTMTISCEL